MSFVPRSATRAALAGLVLLALPAAARAQAVEAPSGIPGVSRPQVLSFQPLGIPALFFSGEYERAVNENVTLGAGASYFAPDELTLLSGDVKARFYPGLALRGFAIGVTAGFMRVGEDYSDEYCEPEFEDCDGDGETATGATLGVQLDYQWLLGKERKYTVALGAGMKRFLGTSDNIDDFTAIYPTARASFGFAF